MSDFSTAAQRIWVVDDDRAVRFVLCTALREAGYQVVDFDSAASALQALGEGPPPALLFTDVRIDAVKIGMLGLGPLMVAVVELLAKCAPAHVWLDPVMVAKPPC
ncbi:hypothetical protein G6F24_018015 [Rhizopus arrhizus]|nr:hypothetical protein G6F24_018015 [Rhizopus arrhizus]